MAYAAETGMSWDDAEEVLYGHRAAARPKCPICGRKCGGRNGVKMHILSVHTAPRLKDRVDAALKELAEASE